jgi:hypothetical protein
MIKIKLNGLLSIRQGEACLNLGLSDKFVAGMLCAARRLMPAASLRERQRPSERKPDRASS